MSTDLATPVAPAGALRLADWGVIRAAGPEARSFLHGQLTQDVALLPDTAVRLAGYCTAKGRLLASFVMWRDGADDVLLACSADVLPAALKRLSMFVLRARCTLSDASAEVPLWGLAGGPAELAALGPGGRAAAGQGTLLRLPDALWQGQSVPRGLWAGAGAGAAPPSAWQQPALPGAHWLGLEAASGAPRVVAATVEQFVPQMVNLERVGGVSFKKGCYPGQEVVARSQFRGTLKRRGALLAGAAVMPGHELFHSADPQQPAGLVALAGELPGVGPVAFAEVKIAALEAGTLHAGAADGPVLRALPLPYAVDTEVV